MFGSLVIVFPTPHEGGALLLRHLGREWKFDSGKELAAESQPAIGYVAFFSDIEHEVTPVISGHRITLTYNLYFDDDGPVSANDTVSEHISPPLTRALASNEHSFRAALSSLLANPEFLGDGGTLAFGLRHIYPIKDSLKHVYSVLKGSDAVVYQSVRALGFQPVLYLYYETSRCEGHFKGVLVDKMVDFSEAEYNSDGDVGEVTEIIRDMGGIVVHQQGWELDMEELGSDDHGMPEMVEWVTPLMTFNRRASAYATYGNSPTLNVTYGDVCLVARIGKAGDRLAYPRVAPKKDAHEAHSTWRSSYYSSEEDIPPADFGWRRIFKHGRKKERK